MTNQTAITNTCSQYSDAVKKEAAIIYLVTGNKKRTSEQVNVPYSTLYSWMESDWWDGLIERVRHEKQDELDGQLSQVIDKAFASILDRLEHGDCRLDKDGQIVRVPVSARDATVIAGIAFDKRQILRNLPTSIKGDDSRLNQLADRLMAFAPANVIDGQTKDEE